MNERSATRSRRTAILQTVRHSAASVEVLASEFGVTPSTIRRDLAALTKQGELTRTYGGAAPATNRVEGSLSERARQASRAKHAIALWAESQIVAGETVILDAGTTAGQVARALHTRSDITVVTPSLSAMLELADSAGIRVVGLGGELRQLSQGFVGPLAEAALEKLTVDRLFLGADGITADFGVCEAEATQTRLKELMMRRAREIYVLADSSKIGKRPFHAWAPMPARWTLVTDDGASLDELQKFVTTGARVVIVDAGGNGRELP